MRILLKISSLFVLLVANSAQAGVDIQCTIPNAVSCEVTGHQNYRIKKIHVRADLPAQLGHIDLVNQTFPCVISATVGWDSAYINATFDVTMCESPGVGGFRADSAQDRYVYTLNKGGIVEKIKSLSSVPLRKDINYLQKQNIKIINTDFYGETKQKVFQSLPEVIGQYKTNASEPVNSKFYCCTEGTTQGCFEVNALDQCGSGLDFVACDGGRCTSFPN